MGDLVIVVGGVDAVDNPVSVQARGSSSRWTSGGPGVEPADRPVDDAYAVRPRPPGRRVPSTSRSGLSTDVHRQMGIEGLSRVRGGDVVHRVVHTPWTADRSPATPIPARQVRGREVTAR